MRYLGAELAQFKVLREDRLLGDVQAVVLGLGLQLGVHPPLVDLHHLLLEPVARRPGDSRGRREGHDECDIDGYVGFIKMVARKLKVDFSENPRELTNAGCPHEGI